jgi:Flp pilus assembly pilin Flp
MKSEMTQEQKRETRKNRERGSGLVEYTIIVALLSMLSIGAVKILGKSIKDSMLSSASAAGYFEP